MAFAKVSARPTPKDVTTSAVIDTLAVPAGGYGVGTLLALTLGRSPSMAVAPSFQTTLVGAITNVATTITVAAAGPTAAFIARIDNEFISVTAGGDTTTWTVTRAYSGAAAAHSNGAAVQLGVVDARGNIWSRRWLHDSYDTGVVAFGAEYWDCIVQFALLAGDLITIPWNLAFFSERLLQLEAYSGTNIRFDSASSNAVNAANPNTGAAVVRGAGDGLAVSGLIGFVGDPAVTAGTGYTIRAGAASYAWMEDKIAALSGTETASYTAVSDAWDLGVALYYESGGIDPIAATSAATSGMTAGIVRRAAIFPSASATSAVAVIAINRVTRPRPVIAATSSMSSFGTSIRAVSPTSIVGTSLVTSGIFVSKPIINAAIVTTSSIVASVRRLRSIIGAGIAATSNIAVQPNTQIFSNATSNMTASVSRLRHFVPTMASTSTVSATLVRGRGFPATITGTSTLSTAIVRIRRVGATSAATSTVSVANLNFIRAFRPTIAATSNVAAGFQHTKAVSATAAATSTMNLTIAIRHVFSVSIAATSNVVAQQHILRHLLGASINTTSTVSLTLNRIAVVKPTITATSTTTLAITHTARLVFSTILGLSDVVASSFPEIHFSIVATSNVQGRIHALAPLGTATLTATSNVVASIGRYKRLFVQVSATSTVTASLVRIRRLLPTATATSFVVTSLSSTVAAGVKRPHYVLAAKVGSDYVKDMV